MMRTPTTEYCNDLVVTFKATSFAFTNTTRNEPEDEPFWKDEMFRNGNGQLHYIVRCTEVDTSSQREPELIEALFELYELSDEAEEEEYEIPTREVIRNAGRVLMALYRVDQRRYTAYAMPEGDVAVDAASSQGTKVTIICDCDGSARCLVYWGGKMMRQEYADPGVIPDAFVLGALARTRRAA